MQKKKKSRTKNFRRLMAAVMCLVMTLTYMPAGVQAADALPGDSDITVAASADTAMPEEEVKELPADSFADEEAETEPEADPGDTGDADEEKAPEAGSAEPTDDEQNETANTDLSDDEQTDTEEADPDSSDTAEEAVADEELTVEESDEHESLDIGVTLIKDVPKVIVPGKYQVNAIKTAGFPEDEMPIAYYQFSNQIAPSYSQSRMAYWQDIPQVDGEYPTDFTITIPPTYTEYLQKIDLTVNEETSVELISGEFVNWSEYGAATFSCSNWRDFDPESTYRIDLYFGKTSHLIWSYDEDDDRGAYVNPEECRIYLLDDGNNPLPVTDVNNPATRESPCTLTINPTPHN